MLVIPNPLFSLTAIRPKSRRFLYIQREELIKLRNRGKIDNTVMRRIQRLLDLETERVQLLGTAGHTDVDVDEHLGSDDDKAQTSRRKKP